MATTIQLGIDVGGTKVAAGLVDAEGRLLGWSRIDAGPQLPPAEMVARVADQVAALLDQLGVTAGELAAAGVAVPGDVDPESGRLKTIPNLPRFVGEKPAELFRRALRDRLGVELPVAADNDTCAAVLAEARFGAGRGAGKLLYVTVSTGVGGARYDGRETVNVEPGLTLHPDPEHPDELLENLASGTAIARQARERLRAALDDGGEAAVRRLTGLFDRVDLPDVDVPGGNLAEKIDHLEGSHLGPAAAAGDRFSRELFDRAARHVAAGLAQLLAEGYGEERIVVGGSVAEKVPGFLDRVRGELRALRDRPDAAPGLRRFEPDRDLVAAGLGAERGIVGAVLFGSV
jgi:glucokinase